MKEEISEIVMIFLDVFVVAVIIFFAASILNITGMAVNRTSRDTAISERARSYQKYNEFDNTIVTADDILAFISSADPTKDMIFFNAKQNGSSTNRFYYGSDYPYLSTGSTIPGTKIALDEVLDCVYKNAIYTSSTPHLGYSKGDTIQYYSEIIWDNDYKKAMDGQDQPEQHDVTGVIFYMIPKQTETSPLFIPSTYAYRGYN